MAKIRRRRAARRPATISRYDPRDHGLTSPAVIALCHARRVVAQLRAQAQDITTKDLLAGLANPSRWLTHSGDYTGHRFSPLTQITAANVEQLAAQWTFQTGVVNKFEATPIVVDGMLYVTGALNHAWAIDGRTGRQIWHYQRTLPQGLKVCCGMVNRGFAIYRDRLFMATLDAHFVALEMKTGKVIYDIEMATVPGRLRRHRRTAHRQRQGHRRHRGRRVREPRLHRRLQSDDRRAHLALLHDSGAGRAGQRDVARRHLAARRRTDLADRHLRSARSIFCTGGPAIRTPIGTAMSRPGDNLYTDSLLALDPDTGTLKWHFQFTPHDTHDWDANEMPVLADLTIGGRAAQGRDDGEPQRLLLRARSADRANTCSASRS